MLAVKNTVPKESLKFRQKYEKQFKQVGKKVISLSKDPFPNDSILMQGYSHRHRVDIGEYRIIYEISENNDKIINILIIDKRNDDTAYKKAKRKK